MVKSAPMLSRRQTPLARTPRIRAGSEPPERDKVLPTAAAA